MNKIANKKEYDKVFYERGSWYHRTKSLLEDGKTKYGKIGGFKSPQEAKESCLKYEKQYLEQREKFFNNNINNEIMFKNYIIYWLKNIYCERVESTTLMICTYTINNLIIPNIDYDIKLKQITVDYLDTIIEKASKMTASGGEASRLIIYLALKDAVINGYINYNVANDTKRYSRPKPKIRIINKEQVKKLLQYAQKTNWYLEILLGIFAGLRKGEILGLHISDFDFTNGTVTISRQLVNNYKLDTDTINILSNHRKERKPKTENSIRTMKLPTVILEEVKVRIEVINNNKRIYDNKYCDNDLISCDKFGNSHSLSSLNMCLTKICCKASLPKLTVHSLRHIFSTILIEQGATLEQISGLLGHSSIHTTFEYYCEIMDEKEKILSYMNDVFSVEE
jgi:integrase